MAPRYVLHDSRVRLMTLAFQPANESVSSWRCFPMITGLLSIRSILWTSGAAVHHQPAGATLLTPSGHLPAAVFLLVLRRCCTLANGLVAHCNRLWRGGVLVRSGTPETN